jgi:hypothetical protein
MRKKLLFVVVLLVLLTTGVVAASAGGHNADQLTRAGWDCGPAGPNDWVHCTPPGTGASDATIVVKVFDVPGYPFLGTELLISVDLYRGQPCETDGGGPYHDLRPDAPYFACHHFDTSG